MKKSIEIFNDKFLNTISIFMKISGITLFPLILIREKYKNQEPNKTLNHERIHIEQQFEVIMSSLLILVILKLTSVIFISWFLVTLYSYLSFYCLYLINWVFRWFTRGRAYVNIMFEQEAYVNASNMNYLKNRKHFSFIKYIFKRLN